jgi:HD-like signal output (HDOD) protein
MSEPDWTAIREQALGEFSLERLPPTIELPALPHAVTLFLQKCEDPAIDMRDLAAIIETDTGLTIELLRYVNSSFVGLRHRAKSVQQALSLLGRRKVKMFVTTTGMQAAVRARKSKLVNQACFWNASLQKALFAREVAGLLKCDEDLAFAAGMLQDYLLPVVTNDCHEAYVEFVTHRAICPKSIVEFEQEVLGWNHALAGASLAHRWHLPDEIVVCLLFHHHGLRMLAHPELKRSPAAAVAISAMLPDQMRQEYDGLELLHKLQAKWEPFDVAALAALVDAKQADLGLGVRNDFPLSRRCHPIIHGDPATYSDGSLELRTAG